MVSGVANISIKGVVRGSFFVPSRWGGLCRRSSRLLAVVLSICLVKADILHGF